MNRRQFIQALLYGSAAIVLPIGEWLPDFVDNADFDPTKQYGNFVTLTDIMGPFSDLSYKTQEKIITMMAIDARRHLPKGTEFGILVKDRAPDEFLDPFAEINMIAWKYPHRDEMQLIIIA